MKLKKFIEALWFKPYTPVIFLGLLFLSIYQFLYPPFQKAFQPSLVIKTNTTPTPAVLADSAEAVVESIQKIIDLPTDEEPEIITITDIAKFSDQPFFKKAANGDKLLLYKKNKKAILFNAKDQKIIDVAPITDASQSAQQLAQYCEALATQSAQLVQTQLPTPIITPPGDATPSSSSTTSLTPPISPTPQP